MLLETGNRSYDQDDDSVMEVYLDMAFKSTLFIPYFTWI